MERLVNCLRTAFLFSLVFLSSTGVFGVECDYSWRWVNPAPTGSDILGLAYNGEVFIAVGSDGEILTSPDGVQWTHRRSGVDADLAEVTCEGPLCIAGGGSLASEDGLHWSETQGWVQGDSVLSGGGLFWIFWNSFAFASTDGKEWLPFSMPSSPIFPRLAFGNGIFVLMDRSGATWTSADARYWTERGTVGPATVDRLVFGGGRFVALEGERTWASSDGVLWKRGNTKIPPDYSMFLFWDGARFAIFSSGQMFTSADGLKWKGSPSNYRDVGIRLMVRGGNLWSGWGTLEYGALLPCTSTDGLHWECHGRSVTDGNIGRIRRFPETGLLVATASGYPERSLLTSPDGENWTGHPCGSGNAFAGIAHGADRYVAVGSGGEVAMSLDGETWTQGSTGGDEDLFAVEFGAGLFAAVGRQGVIFTSPDGLSWQRRASFVTTDLNDILFSDQGFLAVGQGATVVSSTNGLTWTSKMQGSPYSGDLTCLVRANGSYYVSSSGIMWTSPDGVSWTANEAREGPEGRFIEADGRFVGLGHGGFGFVSSDNGLNWKSFQVDPIGQMSDLAWEGSRVVAGGYGGRIAVGNCIPYISRFDPWWGPATGGTAVEITGGGLSDASGVYFGEVPSPAISVHGPDSLSALSPPHDPGTFSVTVETPRGRSGPSPYSHFIYQCEPQVWGWTPHLVSTSGCPATQCGLLTGMGLDSVSHMLVGEQEVFFDPYVRVLDFGIPPGPPGDYDLVLFSGAGHETRLPSAIRYVTPPGISSTTANKARTKLTLSGSGFQNPLAVRINGQAMKTVVPKNATTLLVKGTDIRALLAQTSPLEIVVITADGIVSDPYSFTP